MTITDESTVETPPTRLELHIAAIDAITAYGLAGLALGQGISTDAYPELSKAFRDAQAAANTALALAVKA